VIQFADDDIERKHHAGDGTLDVINHRVCSANRTAEIHMYRMLVCKLHDFSSRLERASGNASLILPTKIRVRSSASTGSGTQSRRIPKPD